MAKQHHQQGAESGAGGNSGRRTGADPRIQSGAVMGRKKSQAGRKQSASRPRRKAA